MPNLLSVLRYRLSFPIIVLSFALPSLALAQTDGARNWPNGFATMSSAIQGNILSSPAIGTDGTVYIGVEIGANTSASPAGKLFAIAPNGSQKWVFPTNDWIDSSPAIAKDGTIYFGCWNGNLYAVNPDGTQKWAYKLDTYASASPVVAGDGTIFIGTGSGSLYAINPDGTFKWLFPTLYWIDSAPAIGPDGTIYVGSEDNSLYAINPNGTQKWAYSTGSDIVSSPAIAADGTIYVGSRDQNLYAFTPSGAVKWTFATADLIDSSPVLGPDGTIYIATTGGRVFALNQNGTQKWEYPVASATALASIYSTPAVRADGSLVFGTSNNAIYALRTDGTLLWTSPVGDWADSSPAVGPDGTIYIGCTDKNVYSFAGTSPLSMTEWPEYHRDNQRTGQQYFGAVAGTSGRVMNLSVRMFASGGSNTPIIGYTLTGSGSRSLLVRGVGPGLSILGLTSGTLPDPRITFFNGQTAGTTNDNWGTNANASTISTTTASLGGFPLAQGSLDAAYLGTFSAGLANQTIQVTDNTGGSGLALCELYDNGGSSTARLANLSARTYVGTGANVLISGFVVGSGTRTMLIRGVGPTLSILGVPGNMTNPKLQLFDSRQVLIAENDDWGQATNASTISTVSPSVGAFTLPSGSQDSVMLVTLPQGNYTAQLSGVNSTTGVGLIEVYEVP